MNTRNRIATATPPKGLKVAAAPFSFADTPHTHISTAAAVRSASNMELQGWVAGQESDCLGKMSLQNRFLPTIMMILSSMLSFGFARLKALGPGPLQIPSQEKLAWSGFPIQGHTIWHPAPCHSTRISWSRTSHATSLRSRHHNRRCAQSLVPRVCECALEHGRSASGHCFQALLPTKRYSCKVLKSLVSI